MRGEPRKITDQIDELRLYLRALRADANRASRELNTQYLKRRYTPFAKHLRYRRYDNAHELLEIGEACLADLRHAQAVKQSVFAPGDQVTIEVVLKGHERPAERNIVYDVLPGCYEMWQLTAGGVLFKRGPRMVSPSNMIEIRACDVPLTGDTARRARDFREWAKQFVEQTTKEGRLEKIVERVKKNARFRLGDLAAMHDNAAR